jgi:GMP reductase
MLRENAKFYDYDDVLILPKKSSFTSRKDAVVTRKFKTKHSGVTFSGVPIIAANMDTTGTLGIAAALQKEKMFTALHKYYTADEIINAATKGVSWSFDEGYHGDKLNKDYIFLSIGFSEDEFDKIEKVQQTLGYHPHICVDVANGYTEAYIEFLTKVREKFYNSVIMAGNVATPDIIPDYDAAGVDIIKIGIGPGNFCRTRTTAGVGVPQLTAVMETAAKADLHGIMICADGGVNEYCDFAKALIGGADMVMAGSMFAAHDESGGDVIEENGVRKVLTYGMSSEHAMKKYAGEVNAYRASEGRTVAVPHKGPVANTVRNILGSLRSTMTYTNSHKITDLPQAEMIVVNRTINKAHVQNTVGI